jgi:uncharacterized membrane protein
MATSILNRQLPPADDSHPIPTRGQHYAPLPDRERDGRLTTSAVQTILAEPMDLYNLWRDVAWIPRWQEYVLSVTPRSDGITHWVMGNPDDPDGKRFEFDSAITEDIAGVSISWRSFSSPQIARNVSGNVFGNEPPQPRKMEPVCAPDRTLEIDQTGTVTFVPTASGRGTLVTFTQTVRVPFAGLSTHLAGLGKRTPKQLVVENLRHFKQLAETGEIPSVKGQPHGPRGTIGVVKEWIYGEHNPTPTGTSDRA